MRRRAALAFLVTVLVAQPAARADPLEAARAVRWAELTEAVFGSRPVTDAEAGEIVLDIPSRALDGGRVPVTISLRDPQRVRGLYLIVDENPMPLAAHVAFGPAGNARDLGLQLRVDRYTYVHAVTETDDGALHATARFVKAAGGCSGPPPVEASKRIGHMEVKVGAEPRPQVALSIDHPNCTGMQIDPVTRGTVPPRFLRSLDVTHEGADVLHLETGISLAADPTVSFRLAGPARGRLGVVARDSDETVFERAFVLERKGS